MSLKINLINLSKLCLLLFICNTQLIQSAKQSKNKNNTNIELTPTVRVKATLNNCLKCKSDSFANRITDTSVSVATDITCNGFLYSEHPYSYNLYSANTEEVITMSEAHTYSAFINGNMMYISNGYVANGTCAGNYIYTVGFAMPSDQNDCTSATGVKQMRIIWNMFQIIGICNSVCYGEGIIDFKPAIGNKGVVNY